jgi:hypothetical protein
VKKQKWGIRCLLAAGLVAAAVAPTIGAVPAAARNIGNEGCTPGYWKSHTSNWQEYKPANKLVRLFVFPTQLANYGDMTLLQALQSRGGAGVDGATKILMRAAVAAYLNAAHEGVGYPYRRFGEPGNLETKINAALASLDRDMMLNLAAELDAANNLGCPLN